MVHMSILIIQFVSQPKRDTFLVSRDVTPSIPAGQGATQILPSWMVPHDQATQQEKYSYQHNQAIMPNEFHNSHYKMH